MEPMPISQAMNERQAREGGCPNSPIRATRRRARCASSTPTITATRPLRFFAYAWGEMPEHAGANPIGAWSKRSGDWGFKHQPADEALVRAPRR